MNRFPITPGLAQPISNALLARWLMVDVVQGPRASEPLVQKKDMVSLELCNSPLTELV